MSTHAKSLFPPPPTFNGLTSAQRAQLLRSTKKLEWVLGTAPRLLDEDIKPEVAQHIIDFPLSGSRRPSFSDSESGSSTLYSPDEGRRSSLSSRRSSSMKSSRYIEAYPGQKKLPLLRVRLSATTFDPLASSTSTSDLDQEEDDTKFVLRPSRSRPSTTSAVPTFSIPSTGSIRRQKMERLRRKLGDGVPLDLVFSQCPSHEDPLDEARPATSLRTPAPLPTPTSTPRTSIRTARDSIVLSLTPHKAHRIKRKPVPKLIPTRPAPPPPCTAKKTPVEVKSEPKENERLSLIIESPDEQVVSLNLHLVTERWSESESGYAGDSEPSPSPRSP